MVAGSQPGLGEAVPNPTYDKHIEIFKPPYLFDSHGGPATRPMITHIPDRISYGRGFQIETPDAANIGEVVLVRPGSVTHAFNVEQRLVGLSFTASSGVLNVMAPSDEVSTATGLINPAPPGFYMLFVSNSSGVPSIARFAQLSRPLTIDPPSQADNSGRTATYTVTISDPNAFAGGCVSLSASGAPASTANFSPPTICGAGSTNLTVTDTPATPGGAYTLLVTGRSGALSHSVRTAMIVGDFGLSLRQTARVVSPGSSTTMYTVSVNPLRNFNGPVTLSVDFQVLAAKMAASFFACGCK